MSAAEYVFDPVDYGGRDAANAQAFLNGGMDVAGTPTSTSFRRSIYPEGGTVSKSNVRTLAYFLIVGGVVVWVVGHLAPIRA